MRLLTKVLWLMLALFALVNALEALRYLLPHVPFPVEMDNFFHRRIALSLHALGGAIALLAGPLQFVPRFRESSWNRHRLLGWTYCSDRLAWLVRFALDCAAFADWLDCFHGISHARGRLDCGDRACREVHFAGRRRQAPKLDDSQLHSYRSRYYSPHVPACYFCVPLALLDWLPRYRMALLDPERDRPEPTAIHDPFYLGVLAEYTVSPFAGTI
jgi:hypothetical protein